MKYTSNFFTLDRQPYLKILIKNIKLSLFFLLVSTFLVGILFDRLLISFFGADDLSRFGIFIGLIINVYVLVTLLRKIFLSIR